MIPEQQQPRELLELTQIKEVGEVESTFTVLINKAEARTTRVKGLWLTAAHLASNSNSAPNHTRPPSPAHCNQHLDYVTKESLSSTIVCIISRIVCSDSRSLRYFVPLLQYLRHHCHLNICNKFSWLTLTNTEYQNLRRAGFSRVPSIPLRSSVCT